MRGSSYNHGQFGKLYGRGDPDMRRDGETWDAFKARCVAEHKVRTTRANGSWTCPCAFCEAARKEG